MLNDKIKKKKTKLEILKKIFEKIKYQGEKNN